MAYAADEDLSLLYTRIARFLETIAVPAISGREINPMRRFQTYHPPRTESSNA
jgi:hypothetical protein